MKRGVALAAREDRRGEEKDRSGSAIASGILEVRSEAERRPEEKLTLMPARRVAREGGSCGASVQPAERRHPTAEVVLIAENADCRRRHRMIWGKIEGSEINGSLTCKRMRVGGAWEGDGGQTH